MVKVPRAKSGAFTLQKLILDLICALDHGVASGSAGLETWRLGATSFDSSKLALRISHNRWQECSQQRLGKQSTNHRLVFIDMNFARNVCITDLFCSCNTLIHFDLCSDLCCVLREETSAFVFCLFSI